MDTRFHDALEYALLSLTQGGITKDQNEAIKAINDGHGYVVGKFTARYPENLQNYMVHAQALWIPSPLLISAHKRVWEQG